MKKIIGLICFVILLSCSSVDKKWAVPEHKFRIPVTVNSGAVERVEKPVEIRLDFSALQSDSAFQLMHRSVKVLETDSRGKVINTSVPAQLSPDSLEYAIANLTFLMLGQTPKNSLRYFQVYLGNSDISTAMTEKQNVLSVETEIEHEEQQSFLVKSVKATYYYHKFGAGFASMEDVDGNDWLSYNPGVGEESNVGSGGMYRGLPNMGYPEGYCHPGKEVSKSWIVEHGPIKVSILSESNDKKMRCMWDFFPNFARLTIVKLRTPYWFLYEGTPGGLLQEDSDFCVRPGNIKTLCSESWNGDIDAQGEPGEWIYFGDVATNRSLFMVQHLDDEHTDSYWPMNHEMTVFGFGRLDLQKFMQRQNNKFTIGFVNSHDYDQVKKTIDSAYYPIEVTVGEFEKKPRSSAKHPK